MLRPFFHLLPLVVFCAPAIAAAQSSAWSIEQPMPKIPNRPLTGELFGNDFELESATIGEHALTLRAKAKGGRFGHHAELMIFVGENDLADEIVITPASADMPPHVHMRFPRSGQTFPGLLMYTEQYSMRLEAVRRTSSEIELAIHVSLPDYKKSHLVGRFTATIE